MRKLIPAKTTNPLVKFVRTGEFWLIAIANAALLVVPIVSSSLTPAQALTYGVVLNGTTLVARTVLKLAAIIKPQTGVTPQPLHVAVAAELTALTETVARLAKQLEAAAGSVKSGPAVSENRIGDAPGSEGAIRWQPGHEATNPSA